MHASDCFARVSFHSWVETFIYNYIYSYNLSIKLPRLYIVCSLVSFLFSSHEGCNFHRTNSTTDSYGLLCLSFIFSPSSSFLFILLVHFISIIKCCALIFIWNTFHFSLLRHALVQVYPSHLSISTVTPTFSSFLLLLLLFFLNHWIWIYFILINSHEYFHLLLIAIIITLPMKV